MKYLENFLKISLQEALKTSWRHLEEVLKTFLQDVWRWCEDVLKMSWQDVLKMSWRRFCETSWRRLENVLKTSWRRMIKTNILVLIKTSSEDVWIRWIYSSWSRRLEDVLKTSPEDKDERRLQDVFKRSSSRRMFAGIFGRLFLYPLKICLFAWDIDILEDKLNAPWQNDGQN